jgi:molybdopterin converting factor small subunit
MQWKSIKIRSSHVQDIREKKKRKREKTKRRWADRGNNNRRHSLQPGVNLSDVVVVGVIPPVAAGLGDRGRDVELCHLFRLLEDVDVHALGNVPCDVTVESWDGMLVTLFE